MAIPRFQRVIDIAAGDTVELLSYLPDNIDNIGLFRITNVGDTVLDISTATGGSFVAHIFASPEVGETITLYSPLAGIHVNNPDEYGAQGTITLYAVQRVV
jgi:hypothetical protein